MRSQLVVGCRIAPMITDLSVVSCPSSVVFAIRGRCLYFENCLLWMSPRTVNHGPSQAMRSGVVLDPRKCSF